MLSKVSSLPIRDEKLEIDATHVVKVKPPVSHDKWEQFVAIATQPEKIEVHIAVNGFDSLESA